MNALLKSDDLIARYGCSRQVACGIIKKLPHIKVGKRLLVDERELAQYEKDILRYPAIKPGRRTEPKGPHLIPRRTA